MTTEEFNAAVNSLLSMAGDNQGEMSEILTNMRVHNDELTATIDTAKKSADDLTAQNESLRNANMKLFLQIGEKPAEQPQQQLPENKKPTFDELFDENGGLK